MSRSWGWGVGERPDSSKKSCQVWLVALRRRRFADVAGGRSEEGGAVAFVEDGDEFDFDFIDAGRDAFEGDLEQVEQLRLLGRSGR